jgi:hypothetical protein
MDDATHEKRKDALYRQHKSGKKKYCAKTFCLCSPIDPLFTQMTTWVDPRTGKPAPVKEGYQQQQTSQMPTFESPPSPLSLMDVITVGSPVAVDRSVRSNTSSSSAVTVMSPDEGPPPTERLLPIGNAR